MGWLCIGLLLAAVASATNNYHNCKYSIVGAGWGGTYYAYRISLSADAIVTPQDVCIFDVSSHRVGGRAYSFVTGWEDVRVDLGAYRWWIGSELIKGTNRVVENKPAMCYFRDGYCNDTECLRDPYGNNAGYSTGVEGLVAMLQAAGMRPVYFSHALNNVQRNQNGNQDDDNQGHSYTLTFDNGAVVHSDEVYLNMGPSGLKHLSSNNIIQTGASNSTLSTLFTTVLEVGSGKQHLRYDDAWWFTRLGLTYGAPWIMDNIEPPLEGINYFDAPIKCKAAGQSQYLSSRPSYPFNGTCWGVLNTYYAQKWPNTNDPNQTFVNPDLIWYIQNYGHNSTNHPNDTEVSVQINRGDPGDSLLDLLHQRVLDFHADLFAAATPPIDPSSIPKPTSTVFSVWDSANYRWNFPGLHQTVDDFDFSMRNQILTLVPGEKVYIGNAAWGGTLCGWAEASLVLAERNLVYHHHFNKPYYVSDGYWKYVVTPNLPNPPQCHSNADCAAAPPANTCVTNICNQNNQCVTKYLTNTSCNDYNPCTTQDRCSSSGVCSGTPVSCSGGKICVSGSCQSPSTPPLPNCTAAFGPGQVYWNYVGSDSIRIAFSLPGTAWVGLGVGASMTPADVILAWANDDGSFVVGDRYSWSNFPFVDQSVGGRNDLTDTYASQVNGITTVWFTRKLNTGDPTDMPIYANTLNNFIWGFQTGTPGDLVKHDYNNRDVAPIDITC